MTSAHSECQTSSEYFANLYAKDNDPWRYDSRWYEARKRAMCLASLTQQQYSTAIELGCSNGIFSEQLATRCQYLFCIDGQPKAVELAKQRLASLSHVEVAQAVIPSGLPSRRFDLMIVSEILYYLTIPQLQAVIKWMSHSLTEQGTILACHWRYPIAGFELTGDKVHEQLQQHLPYQQQTHCIDTDFLLTVWQAQIASVAAQEGLID